VKGPRRKHQAHVLAPVLLVEEVELACLLGFLRIRAHDAYTGQVLLHERRERRELLLDLLEAAVDDASEPQHDRRQHDHRHDSIEREPWADPEHEAEREHEAHDRIGRVHDCRAHSHSYRKSIVGCPAHQIARSRAAVERRVESE